VHGRGEVPDMARRRRPAGSTLALRWASVAALALVGLLYVHPLRAYLDTSRSQQARSAEVRALEQTKRRLERQLAVSTSSVALVGQARRLGYVRPGERLYIVKGIDRWRKQLRARLRSHG
jgi:cell division protein FtsB